MISKKVFTIFLFSWLCFALTSCRSDKENQRAGEIIRIIDGDTVIMQTKENQEFRIRIADIDCPEKKQAFGMLAKQFTANEIGGKEVAIIKKYIDRYGRTVGYIMYDNGKDLSSELLKAGMAWNYRKYSKKEEYQRLENEARLKKAGLWAMPNPIPPWEYRRNKKRKH